MREAVDVGYSGYISKRTRRQMVWDATNGRCWYCSADLREHGMTIDHVIPRAKGGLSTLDNLVPACAACNTAKGSLDLEEYRQLQERKTFYGEGRRAMRRIR